MNIDGGDETLWIKRALSNADKAARAETEFLAELDRRLADGSLTDFEKNGGTSLEALKRELGLSE